LKLAMILNFHDVYLEKINTDTVLVTYVLNNTGKAQIQTTSGIAKLVIQRDEPKFKKAFNKMIPDQVGQIINEKIDTVGVIERHVSQDSINFVKAGNQFVYLLIRVKYVNTSLVNHFCLITCAE
jgi:hypothetical protein